jgi:type IV secretion system protein VirB10
MSTTVNPDRGVSSAAVKKTTSDKWKWIGIGAIGAGLVGVNVMLHYASHPAPQDNEKLPAMLGAMVPYEPLPTPAPRRTAPTQRPTASPPVSQSPPSPPVSVPVQRTWGAALVPHTPAIKPAAEPPPSVVFYDTDPPAGAAAPGGAKAGPGSKGDDQDVANSNVVYAEGSVKGDQAGLMGDQTLVLMPGLVPCIMDTAINSSFPGPIQCHVPVDVKPRGVTLLDRGTIIHANYSANVSTGQDRLSAPASWIEDPVTGCNVVLHDAPISDPLGVTGIDGSVDNHYLERFGAAVLMSFASSGVSLAQAALQHGGNTYLSFNSGGGGVESLANALLQSQINIKPTITVNQGTAIAVFIQKPIDFSRCYRLENTH